MSYKRYNTLPQNDFEFLIDEGLRPHHKFLDIGCGGGRLGYQSLSYLDSGNYYAFDKENDEIAFFRNAVMKEPSSKIAGKTGHISVDDFNLKTFLPEHKFDYLYAYSVFTHVGPDFITEFLNQLIKTRTKLVLEPF